MFKVEIGGKTVEADVTFYTAYLYEAEFTSNIIQDVYGRQGEDSPQFVEMEVSKDEDGDESVKVRSIDFSAVNWTSLLKATWAAIKTVNPRTRGYADWLKDSSGIDLVEIRGELINAIDDCFFRSRASEEESEKG